MWKSWINTIVGLWMVLSGIVTSLAASGNFIVCGIILTVLGFGSRGWRGGLLGVLGLWTIFSGFVPSLTAPANLIVTGGVVTILAIWKGTVMARHHEPQPMPQ